ncbi:MAG: hypothetical protein C0436_02365 [Alphaproteobacteria bacterium]|nr:hypothetical protein [Alphaproteobacteria bacterium]
MMRMRSLLHDTKGNVLIIMGAALPVLLMLVGGAIDYSRVYMVRSKAQLALDSGVLAAASSVSSQPPQVVATTYAMANLPENYMDSNLNAATFASNLTLNVNDPNDGTLTVDGTLTGRVRTHFLRIIGISDIGFRVESQSQRGVRPLDLVLIADHSRSMCQFVGSTMMAPHCPKLEDLKSASRTLIDTLYGGRDSLDGVYVGIVPYATHVKYNVFGSAVDPRFGGNGMDPMAVMNPQQTSIREYSNSKAQIISNINSMLINFPTAGEAWTRINVGLDGAWRMLRPDYNSIFAHSTPAPRPFNGETQKAVVLMTDGRNITYCPRDGTPKYINPDDDADLAARCQAMKNDGIIIYTVVFDLNGDAASIVNTKQILENCATNPTYYFDANSPAAMTQAFKEIGDSLRVIRLSR